MLEILPHFKSGSGPIYIQLYSYIRNEIKNGTIRPHTKLPSQRKLAENLCVSRNTVDTAYQQLIAEGYVESKSRKGLFVVQMNHDVFQLDKMKEKPSKEVLSGDTDKPITYNFKYGDINLKKFPYKAWRKYTLESLHADQNHMLLYGDHQGELSLRKHIAHYLFQSRGVNCSPDQIVIGAGTQYLIGLLCNMLGREGTYGMEDPGYEKIRQTFRDYGADLKMIPIDEKGICTENVKRSNAKTVYLTPSHQFPTGIVMPLSRRMELIEWANERSGYIIEDDYDGEFRYEVKPIPSLQGLDPYGNVIYLGTFSKSFIPSMRLSYVVLPKKLLKLYKKNFIIYHQTVSRLHQDTLTRFMESGDWERHINRSRQVYKSKRATLLQEINQQFTGQVTLHGVDSGLHILVEPNNGMTEKDLIATAAKQGVAVYPSSIYYSQPENQEQACILLGFAGIEETAIKPAIQLLNKAWF